MTHHSVTSDMPYLVLLISIRMFVLMDERFECMSLLFVYLSLSKNNYILLNYTAAMVRKTLLIQLYI